MDAEGEEDEVESAAEGKHVKEDSWILHTKVFPAPSGSSPTALNRSQWKSTIGQTHQQCVLYQRNQSTR